MEQIKANETLVDSSLRETKMHGTVDFPVGVYLDDFSDFKNGYICWHWHEEIQISWIIEGEFLCQMEGRTVHLHPGEWIFVNRGVLHPDLPGAKGVRQAVRLYMGPGVPQRQCGRCGVSRGL